MEEKCYANNVKIYNLGLTKELANKAYEILSEDIDKFNMECEINDVLDTYENETGYSAGFSGRSGGYIIMNNEMTDIDFETVDDSFLKSLCNDVCEFDRMCDYIRNLFIDYIEHGTIILTTELVNSKTLIYTAWLYSTNNYMEQLYSGNYKEMKAFLSGFNLANKNISKND